ncbi:MAG: hypothetical protein U0559_01750 [Anaerolineae bacterium]
MKSALKLLDAYHAPIDAAKAHFQLASCQRYFNADLQRAEEHFQLAAKLFEEADLPLWLAMLCRFWLNFTVTSGRLPEAGRVLRLAASLYAASPMIGPYARISSLITANSSYCRVTNILALADYEQAELIYAQLVRCSWPLWPRCIWVKRLINGRNISGRCTIWKPRSHDLKRCTRPIEWPSARCNWLAQVWLQIGHYAAHAYLDKATAYATANRQANFSPPSTTFALRPCSANSAVMKQLTIYSRL